MGYPLHSSERIGAGIEHMLWELSNEGHTCFPQRELLPLAQALLNVDEALIEKEIVRLVEEKVLMADMLQEKYEPVVWLGPFWSYEQGIAKDIRRLIASEQAIRSIDAEKAADWVQGQLQIQFAEQQKVAVIAALTDKVHIIT